MTAQYFFFDTYPGYFLQVLPFALLAGLLYGIHRFARDKASLPPPGKSGPPSLFPI